MNFSWEKDTKWTFKYDSCYDQLLNLSNQLFKPNFDQNLISFSSPHKTQSKVHSSLYPTAQSQLGGKNSSHLQ